MGGPGAAGPGGKDSLSLDPSPLQAVVQQRLDRLKLTPESAVYRVLEEATRIAETTTSEDGEGEPDALSSTVSRSGGKLGSTMSSTTRGNAANVRPRIVPRHCQVAIRANEELFRIFQGGSGEMDVILDNYFMDASTKASLTRTGLLVLPPSPKAEQPAEDLATTKSRLVTKDEAKEMDRQREQAKAEWKKRPDDVATEAELANILGKVNPLYRLSHDAALLLIALVREKAKVIAATLAEHSMALEAEDEVRSEMVWSAVQHDFPAETVRLATTLLRRTHPQLAADVSHSAPAAKGKQQGGVEVLGVRVRVLREGELLWGAKEKRLSVPSNMPCAKFYESSLFRIGNMGESVVFVHEGSKMPAGDSPTAERTTLEEAGIRDGSSVFVFDKAWWEHKQRDDARRGMLTTQRSNKQEVQAIKSAARSKVHSAAALADEKKAPPVPTEASTSKPAGQEEEKKPVMSSPRPQWSDAHPSEAKEGKAEEQQKPIKPPQPALARLKARAAARAAKAEATKPAPEPSPAVASGDSRPPFDSSPPPAEDRRSPRERRAAAAKEEAEKAQHSPPVVKAKLVLPRKKVVAATAPSKAEGTPRPPSPTAQPTPSESAAVVAHVPRPPAPSKSAEVEEEWRQKRKMLLLKRSRVATSTTAASTRASAAAAAAVQKKQALLLPRKPPHAVGSGTPSVVVRLGAQRGRQQKPSQPAEAAMPALASPTRHAGASQASLSGPLRAEDEVALKWLMLKVTLADIQSRVRSYKPSAPQPTTALVRAGGSRPAPPSSSSSGPSPIAAGIFRSFVEDVRVLDSAVKALQAWVLTAGLQPPSATTGPASPTKAAPQPSSAPASTTAASRAGRRAGPTPVAPAKAPPARRAPQVGGRQLTVAKASNASPAVQKPTNVASPSVPSKPTPASPTPVSSPSRPTAPSKRGPDAAGEPADELKSPARPTFSDRVAAARAARKAAAAAGDKGTTTAAPSSQQQQKAGVVKPAAPERPHEAPASPRIDPLAVTAPDPFRANSSHGHDVQEPQAGPGLAAPSAYADDDFEDEEGEKGRRGGPPVVQVTVDVRHEAPAPVQQPEEDRYHEEGQYHEKEGHYYEEEGRREHVHQEEEAAEARQVGPVEPGPDGRAADGEHDAAGPEEYGAQDYEAEPVPTKDEQPERLQADPAEAVDVEGHEHTQPNQAVQAEEGPADTPAVAPPVGGEEDQEARPTALAAEAEVHNHREDTQSREAGEQEKVTLRAADDTENGEQVNAA